MEKIVPGAPAIKPKVSKKDQYLLKRRDDARAPALPPAVLPDATPASDDGGPPPGFPTAEPQTPPLPSSTGGRDDEEFMLQRREIPPAAGQATDGGATADAAAPKKAVKTKKARKREREGAGATADESAAAGGEPKTKKKKKKLAELELNAAAPSAAPSGGGAKPAPLSTLKVDLDNLDLKQVMSDLRNLPMLPSYGAGGGRISDACHSFLLAFRSKHYKKSYENDPPEESKKGLDIKPDAASAAADGQPPKPVKKKPVMRPIDPTSAGVKRGPSDRQEEMASKKKIKLEKIKNLAAEKKAGLEKKDAAPAAAAMGGGKPAVQQPRAGMKDKAQGFVKKKLPVAAPVPAKRMASPTALMMKFPPNSTLPSVASLKARFARFGPLDIDGIRVYWKSHMCRVIYKYQSDAEHALKYAKANAIFGQAVPNYHLRGIESSSGADQGPEPALPQQQRSDLRLMETTPFRPGSSGNGAPLTMSRAAPARTAVGQQPKSILKKNNEDGPASALRDSPRVKFMLDGGDSKLEPPAMPASNSPDAAAPVSKVARSIGFAQPPLQPPARPAQTNLQPPMRAQQQPPRASDAQPLPPPPPLPYQPRVSEPSSYQPRLSEPSPYQPYHTDVPPSVSMQPSYQQRDIAVPLMLSGQQPLPYPPRAGFPSHQYSPRSDDLPPSHFDNSAVKAMPSPFGNNNNNAANAMPLWKRGGKEFNEELMRVMLGIAKMVEPLMDKNGNFPYHLFGRSA